jgi:arylsulfatase A-like enzyme
MQHVIPHGQERELGYSNILKTKQADPNFHGIYRDMALDLSNAQVVANYLAQPKEKPFFLSYGMTCTHFPLPEPAEDINPAYLQPPPPLPDTPEIRKDMAGYHTLARHADHCVGMILDALDENGLADNTLVIFTTDHGIAFPWMKCNLFDQGIGVSLILRFPRGQFGGQVIDSLVSHLDLYPTLCELTETEPPSWLEGNSLLPLIHNDVQNIRYEIFGEVTYHAAYEPIRCIRTERYKYIRYFDDFANVVRSNIDDSRGKRFLMAHGLSERHRYHAEMLFDLYFDPNERENLVDREDHSEIKDQLATRLHNWMTETSDPLLKGPVPLPEGGFANRQDDLHPN